MDVEIAAEGAVWAACLNAGQVCTASERFYVERAVAKDFVEGVESVRREPESR